MVFRACVRGVVTKSRMLACSSLARNRTSCCTFDFRPGFFSFEVLYVHVTGTSFSPTQFLLWNGTLFPNLFALFLCILLSGKFFFPESLLNPHF